MTLTPDDQPQHAAALMGEHHASHLVVADERGRPPVGIISTFDLARAFAASRI